MASNKLCFLVKNDYFDPPHTPLFCVRTFTKNICDRTQHFTDLRQKRVGEG